MLQVRQAKEQARAETHARARALILFARPTPGAHLNAKRSAHPPTSLTVFATLSARAHTREQKNGVKAARLTMRNDTGKLFFNASLYPTLKARGPRRATARMHSPRSGCIECVHTITSRHKSPEAR